MKRYRRIMILLLVMSLFLIIPASFASDNLTMAESAEIEADEPAEVPVLEATDDSEVVGGGMNIVYVNAENGTDDGSGTDTDPVRTISKGYGLTGSDATVYLTGTFKGNGNSELTISAYDHNDISFIGLGEATIDCENGEYFAHLIINLDGQFPYACGVSFENILFITDYKNANKEYSGLFDFGPEYDIHLDDCLVKYHMDFSAKRTEITAGETAQIDIKTPTNSKGTCLIEYNGANYTGDFEDGRALIEIPNLKAGDYEFTVQFLGDDQFVPTNTTAVVKVNRKPLDVVYVNAENGTDNGAGTEDDPVRTIQQGFGTVNDNGIVYLTGTFKGEGNSNLLLQRHPTNVTFIGLGETVIEGGNSVRFAYITGKVSEIGIIVGSEYTFCNISFINFHNNLWGGVFFIERECSLTLNNCLFENNTAHIGGAIYNDYVLTVMNCSFLNNRAYPDSTESTYGGAIYSETYSMGSNICIYGSEFINNTASEGQSICIYGDQGNVNYCAIDTSVYVEDENINLDDNWWAAPGGYAELTESEVNINRYAVLNITSDSNTGEDMNITVMLCWNDGNQTDIDKIPVRTVNLSSENGVFKQNSGKLTGGLFETEFTLTKSDNVVVTANVDGVTAVLELGDLRSPLPMSVNETIMTVGETAAINITTPANSNGTCLIEYDGTNYTCDFKNGLATIEIPNLKVGEYEFTVKFLGDDLYLPTNTTAIVKVKKITTFIYAETFEKYQGDDTKFQINLTDENGNPVVGMGIKVNITGKTYTIITDENGIAVLPINLKPGIHPATAFFNGRGNYANATPVSTNVSVMTKVRIDQHKDLVKDYGDADKFTVHAVDKYGKSVGANAKVKMTVAGKTYTAFTDSQGYASLAINLKPGTYDITCEYAGYSVTHKINVKQVLSATNRQYKKASSYQFTATLKHTNGNPISGKTVTFTFNGKTYTQTTNSKGEATITIKEALNLGTYNIAIKYLDSTIKKTITIK